MSEKELELPKTNFLHDGRPLRGIRVLDCVVGPMAAVGRQLAELGADVIRLEPNADATDRHTGTTVGGISLNFVAANLGKRAAFVDQMADLLPSADILLAAPGVVDVTAIRQSFPKLVIVAISDFGQRGRFSSWQGSGAVYHALSGELSRSGLPDREPLLPPSELAVECAVAQVTFATMAALWHSCTTGEGDHLDVSALDGAAQALDPGYGMTGSATAGVPASQMPRGRAEARHMYPILPCKDGYVRLCVLAPRQWRGMFEWMGRPQEFADPSFDKLQVRFASKTLLPAITQMFADKTRAEIEAEALQHGVPAASVVDLMEAVRSEQMVARDAFIEVPLSNAARAPFPNGACVIDGERMGVAGPAPAVPEAGVQWLADAPRVRAPGPGNPRPLDAIRVLDFGVIVVGAETGRLMGDLGADVVKVESSAFPDGGRQNMTGGLISQPFATGHRNKRSLGLNLRDPGGRKALLELVRDTDVLLANFKGGTLQSLGLDYNSLKEVNPGIIVVDSSAFGATGPWATRMGYGPLVRAASGLTMGWRYCGEPESFSDAVTVYPDHVAARIGASAVIALLIRRQQTGKGGEIEVSQAEVMLGHFAVKIAATALAESGIDVTADPEVTKLCACAGDDEWCAVTIRSAGDERALAALTGGSTLAEWLAPQTPDQAMEALQAAGVPAGAMLRVADLPGHEYFQTRQLYREVGHPHIAARYIVETGPVRAERMPDPPEAPAPLPAEHTSEILGERLGLSSSEIAALLESGAVEQWKAPGRT